MYSYEVYNIIIIVMIVIILWLWNMEWLVSELKGGGGGFQSPWIRPWGKDVCFAFLDLEKAYDRVDRDAMWNVLRLNGIGGRLL